MVKPWDRFIAILTAIKTVIGLTLIPVLYPLLNRLADMGQTFARWMQLFPNIARVVGYAALALLSFAAVCAVANIVMGVSSFVMMGMTKVLAPVARLLGLNRLAMLASNAVTQLFTAGLRGLRAALLAASIAARMGSASFLLMIAPIAAVALAIAGVVLAVIKFWQRGAGASQHGQKNLSQTKIALHRTRLRFLDHKNFSALFFYKPDRQTAPVLAALRKTGTEKIEKNLSVFHFYGSVEDLRKIITNR